MITALHIFIFNCVTIAKDQLDGYIQPESSTDSSTTLSKYMVFW